MRMSRFGTQLSVHCPAKLNLVLEVLGRRHDGFHEVCTLMVAIDRFDTLIFSLHPQGGDVDPNENLTLDCCWAPGIRGRDVFLRSFQKTDSSIVDLPEGTDNIVVRAMRLLARHARIPSTARVWLVKRIPSAAGLGGGSSDAAAALLAANTVWNLGWSRERLAVLAAELGSDVAFFLGPPAAICRGRGERIEPVTGLARLDLVVVRPPVGLATRDVYRNCQPTDEPISMEPMLRALREGNLATAGKLLTNRLEPAAERLSPWIGRLRDEMDRLDCVGHRMTGSGTAFFGICRHARHARRVAQQLRGRNVGTVFRAATLNDTR